MGGVIADRELALDDRPDPGGRPDVAPEPVGFGPLGQEGGKLGALLGAETVGRTRGDAATQGFVASFPRPFQPLADRSLGDAQRRRDGTLLPALLGQVPRAEAAPFPQVAHRFADGCRHTRPTSTSRATFTNLCGDQ